MDIIFNNLTFFSVKGIMFLVFSILAIIVFGYALGRIDVKGVSLGTAGVFIIALLFGALFGGKFLAPEVGASMNNILILKMEEIKVMEGINEGGVIEACKEVTKSNGNLIVKIAVGALVAAAGVGAVIFYKKKKAQKLEDENVDSDLYLDEE